MVGMEPVTEPSAASGGPLGDPGNRAALERLIAVLGRLGTVCEATTEGREAEVRWMLERRARAQRAARRAPGPRRQASTWARAAGGGGRGRLR
jgi:hypothetical protein